ncbi:hypothetical protein BGZ98_009755, partial [Dissophora globulifera]
ARPQQPYPQMPMPPQKPGSSPGRYWSGSMPTPHNPPYPPANGNFPFVPPGATPQYPYGVHSPGTGAGYPPYSPHQQPGYSPQTQQAHWNSFSSAPPHYHHQQQQQHPNPQFQQQYPPQFQQPFQQQQQQPYPQQQQQPYPQYPHYQAYPQTQLQQQQQGPAPSPPSSSPGTSSSSYRPSTTYTPESRPSASGGSRPSSTPPRASPASQTNSSRPTPSTPPEPAASVPRPTSTQPQQQQQTPPTPPRARSQSESQGPPSSPTPSSTSGGVNGLPPRSRAPQDRNDYYFSYPSAGTDAGESSTRSEPAPSQPQPQPQPSARSRQPPRAPQVAESGGADSILKLEHVIDNSVEPRLLSVKVIKALLDSNCVTYAGILEKSDLEKRLQELIDNTKLQQEKTKNEAAAASAPSGSESPSAAAGGDMEENVCKICFDGPLNCVMLNCGHLSTCLDCGKQIMEADRTCPICREYIVKLLQVFRA